MSRTWRKLPSLNEDAIAQQAKKDGFFVVITNGRELPADEIIAAYKNLWAVEDVFGEIKGSFKARPVFQLSLYL